MKFPVVFVGHGNPMNAIANNGFTLGWENFAKSIPKPRAIVCISAHWQTKGTKITASLRPSTIYDFYGFPDELSKVQYCAPGDIQLAEKIKLLLEDAELDNNFGFDHGCWCVLKKMFPKADIPVVQISLNTLFTPQQHFEFASKLASLRDENILIIGSGNIVHNLSQIAWNNEKFEESGFNWANEASIIIKKLIVENDTEKLINYKKLGSSVNMAIPTPEHFLPLLYVLAQKNANDEVSFFNDKAVMGSLTMTCVKIA